jgi:hypothetical protein
MTEFVMPDGVYATTGVPVMGSSVAETDLSKRLKELSVLMMNRSAFDMQALMIPDKLFSQFEESNYASSRSLGDLMYRHHDYAYGMPVYRIPNRFLYSDAHFEIVNPPAPAVVWPEIQEQTVVPEWQYGVLFIVGAIILGLLLSAV